MTAYPDLKLYIGGAWRKTSDSLPVLNPADESVIDALPVAARADLDDALSAARDGFRVWSRMSPRARGEIMLKAAALISSLSQNHPLFDGNKRLSLYLTFGFLRINGYRVTFTNDEAFDLVVAVAQSRMELDEIASQIQTHSENGI